MNGIAPRTFPAHVLGVTALAIAGLVLTGCTSTAAPATSGEPVAASAKLGFSGWSVGYLPTAIAIDRLAEQGYEVEAIALGGNPNQLQAAAQGEVDISAIAQILDVVDQGLDNKIFLAGNSNEFVMVARAEYSSCESLDGKIVGIQSEASFVGQLATQWFAAECPTAQPAITVVEGSENRLAAMLQNQMDASPIDLQDWTLLDSERPGEFVIVEDFTATLPIMRGAFSASTEWLAANPEFAEAWVATHLEVYNEIYDDPQILIDAALELLPEIDAEQVPDIVQAFLDAKVWPIDGGLSDTEIQETLDFFNNDGEPFATITSPAGVIDRSFLDATLAR